MQASIAHQLIIGSDKGIVENHGLRFVLLEMVLQSS
jgi:hypothetical protein